MDLIKIWILALTVLTASPAHAEQPTEAMQMVVRAILNSDVAPILKERNTTGLDEYTIEQGQDLVNKYVLKFSRQCHCSPATSTATIIEDLRPTTYDGPPVYQDTVETTEGKGTKR